MLDESANDIKEEQGQHQQALSFDGPVVSQPPALTPLGPRPPRHVVPLSALITRYSHIVLLAGLILGAFLLRLYGLTWDSNAHLHPDERQITLVILKLGRPESIANFFSVDSPLNPKFFAYGSFPIYLLAGVANLLAGIHSALHLHLLHPDGSSFADYDHLPLVGRVINVFFDTGTVIVTYLLAKRLYGKPVALLTVAFVACTPFEIQLAHFYAVDTPLLFFVMLSLLLAVQLVRGEQRSDLWLPWWAGIVLGLALGTKASAAPLLLPLALAYGLRLRRAGERMNIVAEAMATLIAAIIAFAVTNPYAVIDRAVFWAQVNEQGALARGALDYPYVRQFAGSTPYLYQLKNIVLWDMGPPLGLAALGGSLFVLWRAYRCGRPEHLVLLAWFIPYFLIVGSFYTKFSRYMLPIFPLGCMFGAYSLWMLWKLARHQSLQRFLASGLLLIVTGWSLFYSLALLHIYAAPNTRITASRWLYAHIPSGSGITSEVWDDALPLRVDGQEAGNYVSIQLPLYDDDTPEKIELLSQRLALANTVVLSSNRLLGSIPKLPTRYPISSRYYHLLFESTLGFTLAQTFSASPNLLGITIDDRGADESFSVYDHPTVWIFTKTRHYPPQELFALLTDHKPIPTPQSYLSGNSKPLLLSPDEIRANEASPTLFSQFPPGSFSNTHPLLVFYLTVLALGILCFPLTALVFGNLRDRGYAFSKLFALLLVSYLVWIAASLRLAPYEHNTVLAVVLFLATGSLFAFWKERLPLLAYLRREWRLLLATEALFAVAFLFFLWVRMQDPDLWHIYKGGEKPMELAFLQAILRSRYLPPLDPWFAGGTINYYYYGQFAVSILVRLTGISPTTSFNLLIPLLFGLLCSGTASLVYTLTGRGIYALLGSYGMGMIANLDGFKQMLEGLKATLDGVAVRSFDYWQSSRVIPYTINEFPFWSFLYSDLHAHLIDLPITIMFAAMSVNLLQYGSGQKPAPSGSSGFPDRVPSEHRPVPLLLAFPMGLVLGAMAAINTWDVPTYALVAFLALVIRQWNAPKRWAFAAWKRLGLFFTLLLGTAYLAYLPFYSHFQTFISGLGRPIHQTSVSDYVILFALWLFLAVSFLFLEFAGILRTRYGLALLSDRQGQQQRTWALLLALSLLIFLVVKAGLVVVLAFVLALDVWVLWKGHHSREQAMVLCLLGLALAISIGVEIFYVRDFLADGDWERMNTVFKFYMQVWVFYALTGAFALSRLFPFMERHWKALGEAPEPVEGPGPPQQAGRSYVPSMLAVAWAMVFVCLVGASSVFIIRGPEARFAERARWYEAMGVAVPPSARNSLDGTAFMSVIYPGDYGALYWFYQHVQGAPVVLEASVGPYKWDSQVSIYTGLSTLVGWDSHERQQRYPQAVDERLPDIAAIYGSADTETTFSLLHKYHVRYIYLGNVEREEYYRGNPTGQDKFESLVNHGLRIAYSGQGVTIYEVIS